MGCGGRWGEWEDGREREGLLICKMLAVSKEKKLRFKDMSTFIVKVQESFFLFIIQAVGLE